MIDEINPYSNKGFCLYKELSCSSAIPSKGKIQKMQTLYFCQLYFCLHWLQPSIPPVFQIAWGLPTWGFKGLKNSILFLCSFKIFWKSVFEFKNHSERHGKTPWQTARSCRKHATTTVSALRIASSTVAVAEFNLLGSVFVERRVDVFLGFFSGVCLLFGGELAILSLVIPGRSKDINLWKSLGNGMENFNYASFKHRIIMANFIKDAPGSRWHPFF